jgi:uncharacterized protein (DUF1800 family)
MNKLLHLHQRAGFGISLNDSISKEKQSITAQINEFFEQSKHLTFLDEVPVELIEEYSMASKNRKQGGKLPKEFKLQFLEVGKNMNLAWINKMSFGKEQLNEKMTFFWHDHFACRETIPFFAQKLNNTIRKYALGSFRDLLFAVSREAAMIRFLNNRQNRKESPNENFAREVMELFTMGIGNYTEKDVKEAARAFTGWDFDDSGEFTHRANRHDDGLKQFLGKTGNYKGEDILNIILEKPETAKYITEKIYRFFVNENINNEHVQYLSKKFYESDYKIDVLLREILSSDWFFDKKNIAARVKSPVELLAGINRALAIKYPNPIVQLKIQHSMGQILFLPPSVNGWPVGTQWIDGRSLLYRMVLVENILSGKTFGAKPKPDDDTNPNMEFDKNASWQGGWGKPKFDLEPVTKFAEKNSGKAVFQFAASLLLSTDLYDQNIELEDAFAEEMAWKAVVHVCSLPQFQLC